MLNLPPVPPSDLVSGRRYLCYMRAVYSTAIRITSGGWPETLWFIGVALVWDKGAPRMSTGGFTVNDLAGLDVWALPEEKEVQP